VEVQRDILYTDQTIFEQKNKNIGFILIGFGILSIITSITTTCFTLSFYIGSLYSSRISTLGSIITSLILTVQFIATPVLRGNYENIISFVQEQVLYEHLILPNIINVYLGNSFATIFITTMFSYISSLLLIIDFYNR
jgi:hypothetical protein